MVSVVFTMSLIYCAYHTIDKKDCENHLWTVDCEGKVLTLF